MPSDLGGWGCETFSRPNQGGTFQVHELTGWSRDLSVEVAGGGVVAYTGVGGVTCLDCQASSKKPTRWRSCVVEDADVGASDLRSSAPPVCRSGRRRAQLRRAGGVGLMGQRLVVLDDQNSLAKQEFSNT